MPIGARGCPAHKRFGSEDLPGLVMVWEWELRRLIGEASRGNRNNSERIFWHRIVKPLLPACNASQAFLESIEQMQSLASLLEPVEKILVLTPNIDVAYCLPMGNLQQVLDYHEQMNLILSSRTWRRTTSSAKVWIRQLLVFGGVALARTSLRPSTSTCTSITTQARGTASTASLVWTRRCDFG